MKGSFSVKMVALGAVLSTNFKTFNARPLPAPIPIEKPTSSKIAEMVDIAKNFLGWRNPPPVKRSVLDTIFSIFKNPPPVEPSLIDRVTLAFNNSDKVYFGAAAALIVAAIYIEKKWRRELPAAKYENEGKTVAFNNEKMAMDEELLVKCQKSRGLEEITSLKAEMEEILNKEKSEVEGAARKKMAEVKETNLQELHKKNHEIRELTKQIEMIKMDAEERLAKEKAEVESAARKEIAEVKETNLQELHKKNHEIRELTKQIEMIKMEAKDRLPKKKAQVEGAARKEVAEVKETNLQELHKKNHEIRELTKQIEMIKMDAEERLAKEKAEVESAARKEIAEVKETNLQELRKKDQEIRELRVQLEESAAKLETNKAEAAEKILAERKRLNDYPMHLWKDQRKVRDLTQELRESKCKVDNMNRNYEDSTKNADFEKLKSDESIRRDYGNEIKYLREECRNLKGELGAKKQELQNTKDELRLKNYELKVKDQEIRKTAESLKKGENEASKLKQHLQEMKIKQMESNRKAADLEKKLKRQGHNGGQA